MTHSFWSGRRIFLTGHTGFKGGWIALWLQSLGAKLRGYALDPPSRPNMFETASVGEGMDSIIADIRDGERLARELRTFQPDIVIHMAAQALVRDSYDDPIRTYSTNVMGTANLLEAVRSIDCVRVIINVTSDKCYENREWIWGYRETDPMGGYDPYSSSKGCAELVANAYLRSFFNPDRYNSHGIALASVRAGNVIGGGDWAKNRLVPDIIRAFLARQPVTIRNPNAVRPWQHVLEPVGAYLMLAERLWEKGPAFCGGWNFGPNDADVQPVRGVLELISDLWGGPTNWHDSSDQNAPHEAELLRLDTSKAQYILGWHPRWTLKKAVAATAMWYQAANRGENMRALTLSQIAEYESVAASHNSAVPIEVGSL